MHCPSTHFVSAAGLSVHKPRMEKSRCRWTELGDVCHGVSGKCDAAAHPVLSFLGIETKQLQSVHGMHVHSVNRESKKEVCFPCFLFWMG